jgi:hypothetical protein
MACRRNLSGLWPTDLVTAASMERARRERADRPALGNYISRANGLAEFYAFFASQLVSGATLAMSGRNLLSIWAIVVIVIDISVLGRILL